MITKFRVSQIWRILSILLIGMLIGSYLTFRIMKNRNDVVPSINTEINIDKIKDSNIDNIELTNQTEQNKRKKRRK